MSWAIVVVPNFFLAAYYWPSDDIAYARSKGYGIIHRRPNGSDLDVNIMAQAEGESKSAHILLVGSWLTTGNSVELLVIP